MTDGGTAERWRPWPLAAIAGAVALLIAGVVMGLVSESGYRSQRLHSTTVQADILAASLAAVPPSVIRRAPEAQVRVQLGVVPRRPGTVRNVSNSESAKSKALSMIGLRRDSRA